MFEGFCLGVWVDVVFGQYEGHKDDPTVPEDSFTPTLASVVLRISNERLDGICCVHYSEQLAF